MGQVESKKPQWQRAITTVTVNTDNHSLFQTILQERNSIKQTALSSKNN